jgi:hypothetical protein
MPTKMYILAAAASRNSDYEDVHEYPLPSAVPNIMSKIWRKQTM